MRAPSAPATYNGDLRNLPEAFKSLTSLRNWVVWRWDLVKDKQTKVPYQPARPRFKAKNNSPTTWGTYEIALGVYEAGNADGIGFCLLNSGLAAFDIDHCRESATGLIDPWAQELVDRVGSYTEITVSGTGLRIIGHGTGPKVHRKQPASGQVSLETYRRAERYIVVTGNPLPGSSSQLADIDLHVDEIVAKLDAPKGDGAVRRDRQAMPGQSEDAAVDVDHLDLSALDEDCARRLRLVIREGTAPGIDGASRSEPVFYAACEMIRADLPDAVILAVLLDRRNGISAHIRAQGDAPRAAQRALENALKKQARPGPLTSKVDHMARARQLRDDRRPNLLHWRGEFLDWDGARYVALAKDSVEADVWTYLERARVRGQKKVAPFLPDRRSVGETIAALEAVTHLAPAISTPHWLDDRTDPPPAALISFPNGLLDINSGTLLPPTPKLFTQHACRFAYDADAATPKLFLRFLDDVFDGEEDQIQGLQQIFGYCLTADVSFQKMFLIVGPKRSGKGTIASVFRGLLAEGTVCGPNMASFGGTFGLQPLIGRQLAIIDDLRIGSRTDRALIAERLLTISGGGYVSVDRKYLGTWQGELPIKFLIISNEVPGFADDSGALASRFIVLTTRQSFYGREDRDLVKKILEERGGITLWALDGLRSLRECGKFREPDDGAEMRSRLAAASSPVQSFIEEWCEFDPSAKIIKDVLYRKYIERQKENDQPILDIARFAEALIAAGDGRIKSSKIRTDAGRIPHFVGLRLRKTMNGSERFDGI